MIQPDYGNQTYGAIGTGTEPAGGKRNERREHFAGLRGAH